MKPATATLLVLTGLLIATAQAAEPETVTLACEGTGADMMQVDTTRYLKSMGIVINLTTGAVNIPSVNGLSLEIIRDASDELTIIFSGLSISSGKVFTGNVNRVTSDMMATDTRREWKTGKILSATDYSMKCKPTVLINRQANTQSKLLRHRFDARERIGIGSVPSVESKTRSCAIAGCNIWGSFSLAISLIIWTGPDPPNGTRRAGAATGTSEGGADRHSVIARRDVQHRDLRLTSRPQIHNKGNASVAQVATNKTIHSMASSPIQKTV
jgi:hypothetical protein